MNLETQIKVAVQDELPFISLIVTALNTDKHHDDVLANLKVALSSELQFLAERAFKLGIEFQKNKR